MENKIKRSIYNKKYWKANAKRIIKKRRDIGYYKDYYKRTPSWREKMNEHRRNWVKKNPEENRKRNRIALAKYRLTPNYRYQAIKKNAKKKGRTILSKTEFLDWFNSQDKICYYCSVSEDLSKRIKGKVLEIDRKDNDKGYELSNIVLACYICNGVKSNLLTEKETLIISSVISKKWKKLESV